jgi:hypothetical protein
LPQSDEHSVFGLRSVSARCHQFLGRPYDLSQCRMDQPSR